MKAAQQVIDFDQAADTIILLSVDGCEVAVPRRLVIAVPGSKHRYLRPESVLEETPVNEAPPPPRRGWKVCGCPCRGCCQTPPRHCGGPRCGR